MALVSEMHPQLTVLPGQGGQRRVPSCGHPLMVGEFLSCRKGGEEIRGSSPRWEDWACRYPLGMGRTEDIYVNQRCTNMGEREQHRALEDHPGRCRLPSRLGQSLGQAPAQNLPDRDPWKVTTDRRSPQNANASHAHSAPPPGPHPPEPPLRGPASWTSDSP